TVPGRRRLPGGELRLAVTAGGVDGHVGLDRGRELAPGFTAGPRTAPDEKVQRGRIELELDGGAGQVPRGIGGTGEAEAVTVVQGIDLDVAVGRAEPLERPEPGIGDDGFAARERLEAAGPDREGGRVRPERGGGVLEEHLEEQTNPHGLTGPETAGPAHEIALQGPEQRSIGRASAMEGAAVDPRRNDESRAGRADRHAEPGGGEAVGAGAQLLQPAAEPRVTDLPIPAGRVPGPVLRPLEPDACRERCGAADDGPPAAGAERLGRGEAEPRGDRGWPVVRMGRQELPGLPE